MDSFTFAGNMASLPLCKVGYISSVVKSQLYLVYEMDINILYIVVHFKITFLCDYYVYVFTWCILYAHLNSRFLNSRLYT